MATVTGLTAERMLAIEAASIVDGDVDINGHLILIKQDATTIDAGLVKGDPGTPGTNAAAGSVAPVANTTALRSATAQVKTAAPVSSDDAATKLYTDSADNALGTRIDTEQARINTLNPLVIASEIGAAINLNTFTTPGVRVQTDVADATTALNYPKAATPGLLEVFSNPAGTLLWQRFTVYGTATKMQVWVRAYAAGVWGAWKSMYTDNGWIAGSLSNGWVNYAGGYSDFSSRLMNGVVHVRGMIKNGTIADNTVLGSLTSAHGPAEIRLVMALGYPNNPVRLHINTDGTITGVAGLTNTFVALSIPPWPVD